MPGSSPFIIGILIGLISGNLSLALLTTGLTFLIWGFKPGKNFIIISTVLLVIVTGNINFEIIFIYFLTLAWLIKGSSYNHNYLYIFSALISFLLLPLWNNILGTLPAQFLNEVNIAGEILLLTGLILGVQRGFKLWREEKNEDKTVRFLLYFLLASAGIYGGKWVLLFWIGGIILSYYLERNNLKKGIPGRITVFLLISQAVVMGYLLVPVNLFIVVILFVLITYLFLRRRQAITMEIVYFSLLLGIIASRMGLLK